MESNGNARKNGGKKKKAAVAENGDVRKRRNGLNGNGNGAATSARGAPHSGDNGEKNLDEIRELRIYHTDPSLKLSRFGSVVMRCSLNATDFEIQ